MTSYQNLGFQSKPWFLIKTLISDQNFDFWSKPWFLIKTLISDQNLDFSSKPWFLIKTLFSDQNLDFWSKPWFLIKTLISNQNLDFWSKPWFLIRTMIYNQNLDFWSEAWFLIKTLVSAQNIGCWHRGRFEPARFCSIHRGGSRQQTTLVVNNQTDGKHIFRGIPGHPPFKIENDCAFNGNGRAPGQTNKIFQLWRGDGEQLPHPQETKVTIRSAGHNTNRLVIIIPYLPSHEAS